MPNPYVGQLEESITIQLESQVVDYFNRMATESGVSLQNLLSICLKNCAQTQRKISLDQIKAS
ncbi:MAG: antitoxin [Cyanobacteria bacterium J06627_32]